MKIEKGNIYFQQIFATKIAILGRVKDQCGNFSLTKELANVSHLNTVAAEEIVTGLILKSNAKKLALNRKI